MVRLQEDGGGDEAAASNRNLFKSHEKKVHEGCSSFIRRFFS